MSKKQGLFFPYHWYIDDSEKDITCIRVYGIDMNNKNICLRINDFTPYVYIELPNNIKWNYSNIQLLANKIDTILGDKKPLKKALVFKKKLYGVYLNDKNERISFPYLFCSFSTVNDIKILSYKIKNKINIQGCGFVKLKIHENNASPILQLTCCANISTAGWIKYNGKEYEQEEKITNCDYEYKVKWKHLTSHNTNILPKPLVMGFDIEVNSYNPSKFPDSKEPRDKVFQISCVFKRESEEQNKCYLLSLGDPDNEIVGNDVEILKYKTEASLLEGFCKIINDKSPNIIVGYNILGFDIPYLIDRAKLNMCFSEFDKQGFHKYNHAKEKTIKWSSAAYKNQEFQYLDAEGRLYIDLLPLVKRDYKMNNYKLKTVSEYFIGETKDPLSVQGIFKCYRIGIKKEDDNKYSKKAKKAMAICGKYCVQDSILVVRLMDKLKTWAGLTEMAKTCQVSIFSLYTQGQQIKVFSQVYKFCKSENIVVENDAYIVSDNEKYVGAYVFPPTPGRYSKVVPFDFASLYPTTIIAYNIDYHTFVTDESIPDSKCNIMEWQDCIGCIHDPKVIRKNTLTEYITKEQDKIKKLRNKRDKTKNLVIKQGIIKEIKKMMEELKPYVSERAEINKTKPKFPMCEKRRYRFLKEPKGVLPTVLQNLLNARKHTRKVDMKDCYDKIAILKKDEINNKNKIKELESMLDVLDKRQLAYKVSCNSMYGAMGVRRGYLPFMPGAMCTTYMGRVNIEKVAKVITSKYGGELIYGDTDSNYIHFPKLKTAQETWDYSIKVAEKLSDMFPDPIKLEFEEEIYDFFFILTKKRYMYRKCLRDGLVETKIGKKGVLLARRDNSKFVRDIYENVISKIADNKDKNHILLYIIEELNNMCSNIKHINDFIVTKSVGDSGVNQKGLIQNIEYKNEKGEIKNKVGDYIVPMLPSQKKYPKEYEEALKKKSAKNEQEFYLFSLPAQIQLAERMRKRGQRVDNGSRLEYVISNPNKHLAKQYEKVECADYLKKHSDVLKIDYFYYIKALANPLDEVLLIAFKEKDFVLKQYNFRYKVRNSILSAIKDINKPNIIFE